MTPTQEMILVLFEEATIKKSKAQFISGREITPVDSHDMNFRLFKAKYGNINLELLCRDDSGTFFKPIGFYEYEKGGFLSSGKLTITVLNEFVKDYKAVKGLDSSKFNVKLMGIRESGLIAAFSRETVELVKKMYQLKEKGLPQDVIDRIGPYPHLHDMQFDKSLMSNGLQIDLLFSFDGFPQCFLDDKYGVQGALAVYLKNQNGYSLNPTLEHKNNFDKFHQMSLLSALKGI